MAIEERDDFFSKGKDIKEDGPVYNSDIFWGEGDTGPYGPTVRLATDSKFKDPRQGGAEAGVHEIVCDNCATVYDPSWNPTGCPNCNKL